MKKVRSAIINRLFLLLGVVLLFPTAIIFQVVRVNVVEGDKLRELWSAQAIDYIPIPAQRGSILDANGTILVTNSVDYNVAIDPLYRTINKQQIDTICTLLSVHTPKSKDYFLRKIHLAPRGSRYVQLAKGVGIDAYEALHALDQKGLILDEQYRRRYNYDSLAAHALGFMNHKAVGMAGLENFYDEVLKGEDGSQQVQRDRANRIRAIVGAPQKQPEHGHNLVTTIDVRLQAIVEEELRNGVKKNLANKGMAILLDPKTGAIKAFANYPTYNPNYLGKSETKNRRNSLVSDMIEPGSTFKLITAIAALEKDVVDFDEIFETPESGHKKIYGQWMRDHDPLGDLTFREVIEKSSNVATAEIAMRLNKNDFYQFVRNAGFGNPTNIDLPNELEGRLRKPHQWSQISLPWMSVGYEIQVTPIQIAQAYAAFANNGILMQPYIVDKILDSDGNVVKQTQAVEVRKIASEKTLNTLKPIFAGVVSDSGTAEYAQINGLDIVGKTGTAQKYVDGRYRTRYRASFVGFFPEANPKYVCFVLIDEPRTSIYGGTTAAPVFKRIATRMMGVDYDLQKGAHQSQREVYFARALDYRGMSKETANTLLKKSGLQVSWNGEGNIVANQIPLPGDTLFQNDVIQLDLSQESDVVITEKIVVPDVRKLSMRKASASLMENGLQIKTIGSGTVIAQFPKAGSTVRKGTKITLRGKAKSMELAVSR